MRELQAWARALAFVGVCAACSGSEKRGPPASLDVDLPVHADARPESRPPRTEPVRPSSEVMQPNGPPLVPPTEPPPASGARAALGGRCSLSSECEPGLLCFGSPRDASLFEAMPGGYCAPPCSDDADCASISPGSFCRRGEHCTAPCAAGYDSEPDGSAKCGGRDDLACFGGVASGGGCLPICTNDLVCGQGRECYYGSGTCLLSGSSDVLSLDAPIGAACGDPFTCRGYCLGSGEGTPSLCSGACTVGVPGCGGGLSNVCAPLFADGRHGDSGNCFQACRGSADCASGAGECVPSGLLSAAGEAQAHCAPARPSGLVGASQRLSLEDMQATALSDDVLFVQSAVTGAALSRLFVEGGAVCVEGEVPDTPDAGAAAIGPSLAQLTFQFGRIDPPSPRDITGAAALNLTLRADRGLFVYATFVGRPGFEYGTFILEPPLEPQAFAFTPDDLSVRQLGALPWDPALLDAVGLRLADGVGPFRLCVSRLAFE